jgi:hypothetical protein
MDGETFFSDKRILVFGAGAGKEFLHPQNMILSRPQLAVTVHPSKQTRSYRHSHFVTFFRPYFNLLILIYATFRG